MVQRRTGDLFAAISYTFGNTPVLSSSASFSSGGQGKLGGDPDLSVWIYAGNEDKKAGGWYARFVEFGTAPHGSHPGSAPYPFFYPAVRLLRPMVTRNVQRAFSQGLKDAGMATNKPRGRYAKK